jgi:agmatine deiminase
MPEPLNRSPYRMPAEWETQTAVWLSWPSGHPDCWPETLEKVEAVFAEIAAAISRYEPVRINAPAYRHEAIRQQILVAGPQADHLELYDHANDDVWCRDHGPLFVKHRESGEIAVTNWGFNGWGDKFGPYDQDNEIPVHIANTLGMERFDADMILEGGSIEQNSLGQILTTEAVLLNPNRNPHLSREEIEDRIKSLLGMNEIFWLRSGIEGDDTDGHIDDIARFVNDRTIVISQEKDGKNPNHRVLRENRERLGDFRLPDGSRPEIIELDMPDACLAPDWRLPVLPASYVNFLILNGAVLVPVFGQKKRDTEAIGVLGELFPGREIVPINAIDIVREGGAIHCISQQQPA